MKEILFGIATLLALVGLQTAFRYWTVHRTRIAWEVAQEKLKQGAWEAAEIDLGKCIKLMPLWLQPRFVLGALLARQGKLAAAEEQLKIAAALDRRDAKGHIELGVFYVNEANRIDDGVAAFQEALTHDENARGELETDPRLAAFRESDAYARLRAISDET